MVELIWLDGQIENMILNPSVAIHQIPPATWAMSTFKTSFKRYLKQKQLTSIWPKLLGHQNNPFLVCHV